MLEEIQRLKKKAAQESDIPFRIIKENSEIFGDYLLSSFNDTIDKCYFPTALKQATITPVYSKYRPICILPNVSKNFEKCMFSQMIIQTSERLQKRMQHTILPFKNA